MRDRATWGLVTMALGCGPTVLGLDDESGSSGASSEEPGSTSGASRTGRGADAPMDSSGLPPDPPPDPPPETTSGGDEGCGGDLPAEIQPCDPWQQDCPDFQKCNPYAIEGNTWDATGCFPVACDAVPVGGECQATGASGLDNCEARAMCWDVDANGTGTCVSLCHGTPRDPTCPNPDDTCIIANDDALTLCLPSCDPSAAECPEGQSCNPVDDAFVCTPTGPPSPGSQGQPCGQIATCDPGLVCIVQEVLVGCKDVGCCTAECNLADPDADQTCAEIEASYSCVPLYPEGEAPPGAEGMGICAVAPE